MAVPKPISFRDQVGDWLARNVCASEESVVGYYLAMEEGYVAHNREKKLYFCERKLQGMNG